MPNLPIDLSERHFAMLLRFLERWVPDAEVWAYGSRVNGTSHEGSDLDLVLRNPKNPDSETEGLSELREALQASMLPILVDVHSWSRLPPAFREEIERQYVVLRKAD